VTVRMSDFAFAPDSLRLRTGTPVRLRLVNESSGGHDFSAPAFFAASSYPAGSAAPTDGTVEVAAGHTVELTIIPHTPGTYPVECTHLLHAFFGMTASIDVVR
jgi:plastocyanin